MSEGVICQSCGMPMKNPRDLGTKADGSASREYCHFCFKDGRFTEITTLEKFTEKQVLIAKTKLGMPEDAARAMAVNLLPKLKRWQK